jgi:predicted metal-dependent enzyme (double-stranded beta helix superfamily)
MLRGSRNFDIEDFVEDCLAAWGEGGPEAVKVVLERALHRPGAVRKRFGEPTRAGLQVLYPGPELVVENMVWAPGMSYPPHDHRTPVMTGVYAGTEINQFFHKIGGGEGGGLVEDETVVIGTGDAVLMARDAIHRIANPDRRRFTGAFHIYMGDYLHSTRSIWYPDGAHEAPASLEVTQDIFEAANRELAVARGGRTN